MHHGPEFNAVVILCATLLLGVATRSISKRLHVPYTVALLLLGAAIGLVLRAWGTTTDSSLLALLTSGKVIGHDLIIFVFLPALVFESAYGLDSHAFLKELGAIAVLAIPALLVSTGLTAAMMVGLTQWGWQWTWPAALVFGAAISATDPVAVVGVLREVGAPKRLSVLIEGESLLNDGTAIVVYGVLTGLLVSGNPISPSDVALRFVTVASGGILVGLLVAVLLSYWISKVFNDARVEVALSIVLAYAAMIIAEGYLHVSGVMAVVTAGLWMSSAGRTRVSPEVRSFLHHFWEFFAYIANTIIFLLVGVIIALQAPHVDMGSLAIIAAVFVGLLAVRFAVTFSFRPLINIIAEPVSAKQSTVLAWGGLRGAVSLALALALNQQDAVPQTLRQQQLLLTAAIVFLTIVVNGGTIEKLLKRFGYDRAAPLDERASLSGELSAIRDSANRIERLRDDKIMPMLPWPTIATGLADRVQRLEQRCQQLDASIEDHASEVGRWRRVLELERNTYWADYNSGVLGAQAVRLLDGEITKQVDRLNTDMVAVPAHRSPSLPWLSHLTSQVRRRLGLPFSKLEFGRLALMYDLAQAEVHAAQVVLKDLAAIVAADTAEHAAIGETYRRYHLEGTQRLEELRTNLPEVSCAIELRLASRIALNFEREAYQQIMRSGRLDGERGAKLIKDVEQRMKALWHTPVQATVPSLEQMLAQVPLLEHLPADIRNKLEQVVVEQVLEPNEVLFRQGDDADSMYIVVRGAVYVIEEGDDGDEAHLLNVLGGGEVLGEMALLADDQRNATIRAATTTTVARIAKGDVHRLVSEQPALAETLWVAYARHAFDRTVRRLPAYAAFDAKQRQAWFGQPSISLLEAGEHLPAIDAGCLFLVSGELVGHAATYRAPALVHSDDALRREQAKATSDCRYLVLAHPSSDEAR